MKIKQIKNLWYNANLTLIYNVSWEDTKKYIEKKYDVKLDWEHSDGRFFYLEKTDSSKITNNIYHIYLESFNWYKYEQALLVHEVFHFVMTYFDHIGMKYETKKSSEAYSYFLQNVYQAILNVLDQEYKKDKKKKRKK